MSAGRNARARSIRKGLTLARGSDGRAYLKAAAYRLFWQSTEPARQAERDRLAVERAEAAKVARKQRLAAKRAVSS